MFCIILIKTDEREIIMKKKVLIVEDEQDTIDLEKMIMLKHGYNVSVAMNAEEALKIIETNIPDIILLDVMLPGKIDGFEFCKMLKSSDKSKIPIIIFTAKSGFLDLTTGLDSGADEYLTKPFSAEGLVQSVKRLLGEN